MIALYIYRSSQAGDADEAFNDGAVRFLGDFEKHTIGHIKDIVKQTADCLDSDERMVFVEVSS